MTSTNTLIVSSQLNFLYFAYGSNLLSKRMHVNNHSAKFKAIAVLKNYTLGFGGWSKKWQGAPATILEKKKENVWGVVWELSIEDEENLNRQESIYRQLNVIVESPSLGPMECKTYQLPPSEGADAAPSLVYKQVIVKGAEEFGLPRCYIEQLEAIKDNGNAGRPEEQKLLH